MMLKRLSPLWTATARIVPPEHHEKLRALFEVMEERLDVELDLTVALVAKQAIADTLDAIRAGFSAGFAPPPPPKH